MLPYEKKGNVQSNFLLIFFHGYPDKLELWKEIVRPFEKDCFILNISYPNNSELQKMPLGIDLFEVTKRLKMTIDENNKENRKMILISHDWGALIGYMFDYFYPSLLSHMIAMDSSPRMKINSATMSYQLSLIFAFMIGGTFGKEITQSIIEDFNHKPEYINSVDSTWNYLYYYYWRDIKDYHKIFINYKPSCSITFIYGTNKPFMFHSNSWLKLLKTDPKNEVISTDATHWVMKDKPYLIINSIQKSMNSLQFKPKF